MRLRRRRLAPRGQEAVLAARQQRPAGPDRRRRLLGALGGGAPRPLPRRRLPLRVRRELLGGRPALVLQGLGALGRERRIAPLLDVPDARLRGGLRHQPPARRAHAPRGRHPRRRDPVLRLHELLGVQPLRAARRDHRRRADPVHSPGRERAEPAAPAPDHGDPPADPLHRLRGVRDPVRVLRGGAVDPPARRRLDPEHPPVDADRLVLPRQRHPPRRPLGLRGARLGRLLGLGPGRERRAHALAHRHRLPPLGDDPGTEGDAEDLERGAGDRDLPPLRLRHLPDPERDRLLGARLRVLRVRLAFPRLHHLCRHPLGGAPDHPDQGPPHRERTRSGRLARVGLPLQQPAAARRLLRGALGDALPGSLGKRCRASRSASERPSSTG